MKRIYPYILGVVLLLMCGCNKFPDYQSVVYFTGTEDSPIISFALDEPAGLGITVTSSVKATGTVTAHIKTDPSLVDAYNKSTGRQCQPLPATDYSLSKSSVKIQAGSNISDQALLDITTVANVEDGVIYCIPIVITSLETDSDLKVLEASRITYVIVRKTIVSKAVSLSSRFFKVPGFYDEPRKLAGVDMERMSAVTMEARVRVTSFQTANPFISTIMGVEEIFVFRLGDVTVPNNILQIAGGNSPASANNMPLSPNIWYHVAVTYNGSSVNIYINGKLEATGDASNRDPVNLLQGPVVNGGINDRFYIGKSTGNPTATGRGLNGYISEARVWSRALSITELQDNMCYVDPTSEGLVAYWRFNEADASGNVLDLTGHGYTATSNNASLTWMDIRCPF